MKHIVVDLEMNEISRKYREAKAVCKMEIIEIGAVLLDENYTEIGHFKTLVKPQFRDSEEFHKAYKWMAEQMKFRLSPPPAGVEYPIWAWHTRDWQHKKPDLRSSDMRHFTEPYVCIELEVPEDEVLLSDFDAWHFVLNDFPCIECHSEEEFDKIFDTYSAMTVEEQEKVKVLSWDRIFDITPMEDEWNINGKYIQASFWELKPEYVVSVRHIREKSKRF